MGVRSSVKKVPSAVASLLKFILSEAKPDEIQITKDGSVVIKYKKAL